MKPLLAALLLAGCATAPVCPLPPTPTTVCPPAVPVPAGLPRIHTQQQNNALEIRVELAREAERRRGDACAQALGEVMAR